MEAEHNPDALPGQRGYMSRYRSQYGKPDGLADRLEAAADVLARDKTTPWLGLGLHKDLLCAAAVLRGKKPPADEPEPEAWEIEATKAREFDL